MADCCIVGGGVIGLSLARELAGRGATVELLSRDPADRTASWAAAGILPPVVTADDATALERFTAWSDRLHQRLAVELKEETGIDNGLRRCGGLHAAGSVAGRGRLDAMRTRWRRRGIEAEPVDATTIAALEPALAGAVRAGVVTDGVLLADESQIRPSRHLDALVASCRARGVAITPAAALGFETQGGRVVGVRTASGTVRAGRYCLAAGSWSEALLASLGLNLPTTPIRGQIVLLRTPRPLLQRIVSFGLDYLVPRPDGRLLVGATIEDAGFEDGTTRDGEDALRTIAHRLLGPLPDAVVERSWSGLRPGSHDGLPTLGAVPGWDNVWLSTGHFRAGLHLSTGSALLLAGMMLGGDSEPPPVDHAVFAPHRSTGADGESVAAYLARVAVSTAAPP